MLKLLKQITPWMVASLLVATTAFGQESRPNAGGLNAKNEQPAKPCAKPECKPKSCPPPCPQPCPPTQLCPSQPSACCPPWPMPVLNAAYNYPARTQTRCPWDLFFDISFIYWQPTEDNIALGKKWSGLNNATDPVSTTSYTETLQNTGSSYKPGFKIGMGGFFEHDNWDLHLEYTWFHNQESASFSVPSVANATQALTDYWPEQVSGGTNYYDSGSGKWKLQMDILDLDLGRWYYVGTKLTFHPTVGLRAAWIHQRYSATFSADSPLPYATVGNGGAGNSPFHYLTTTGISKSNSWGLGAKAGLDTNWMLGYGFRLYGCGEGDLLFTRYTTLSTNTKNSPNAPSTGTPTQSVKSATNLNTVRAHLDLELGFGWGTYWDCNNWYTDLAIGYDFQVFFDQNMFGFDSQISEGDLATQGLNVKFSLTF